MRKVAFTGTTAGLTEVQVATLRGWFAQAWADELHHGMAEEGDVTAHVLALARGWRVVGHPGVNRRGEPAGRGIFNPSDFTEILPELPYLKRNRVIVAGAELLLAAPRGPEVRRSGTWATVRYAREAGVPVLVFWPEGRVSRED